MSNEDANISETVKTETESTIQIKTHNAANISDETFWKIHSVGLVFILISVIVIFVLKGPRRRDAIAAMKKNN